MPPEIHRLLICMRATVKKPKTTTQPLKLNQIKIS